MLNYDIVKLHKDFKQYCNIVPIRKGMWIKNNINLIEFIKNIVS